MKRKSIRFIFGLFWFFILTSGFGLAQNKEGKFAVLIGGSGWNEEYSSKYKKFLLETKRALIENFDFSGSPIFVLAGSVPAGDKQFNGESRAERIRSLFKSIAESVTPDDNLFVILFGHGSYDSKNGKFNIPGRDLTDADFAAILSGINSNRLIFINTTQASFPFIQALSNQKRIVITATKSGTQKTETVFPAYLVTALRDPASDLDKNGDLSVLEIFSYASDMTERFFGENNHLATEHPQLEDTGGRQIVQAFGTRRER